MEIKVENSNRFNVVEGSFKVSFIFEIVKKDCYFDYEVRNFNSEFFMDSLNLFTNYIIKKHRVYTINILREAVSGRYNEFYYSLYYENKNYMTRKVEAYRYLIEDRAFDNEGFIINQGILNIIPFKSFKSDAKGCGWISLYNLFKLLHKEKTINEVSKNVSKYALFRGLLGQDIFSLFYYLRKNNIDAYLTPIFKKKCIRDIKNSKCGIILYVHKRGSHYVAYKNLGNGKIKVYNAVYGRTNHIVDVDEFYKQYSITPFSMVICIFEV